MAHPPKEKETDGDSREGAGVQKEGALALEAVEMPSLQGSGIPFSGTWRLWPSGQGRPPPQPGSFQNSSSWDSAQGWS